jgi:predicted Fe-Mo cluster-binding NifX family protein
MKIAFVTDDGQTISAHFGQAKYLSFITMENGEVTSSELAERELDGHHNHHHEHEHGHGHGQGQGHGGGGGFQAKFLPLRGCDLLIARGMGPSAVNNIQSLGVEVILTDLKTIDAALAALVDGSLAHNPRRVHQVRH